MIRKEEMNPMKFEMPSLAVLVLIWNRPIGACASARDGAGAFLHGDSVFARLEKEKVKSSHSSSQVCSAPCRYISGEQAKPS